MLLRHRFDDLFWRPWLDFHRFGGEIDDLFTRGGGGFARLNLFTSDDAAVVTAQLPGVDPDSLDITVHRQTLTLKGERKAPDLDATDRRRERSYGSFARTVQLPFAVDADGIEASYNRGILEVRLPRVERDMPRKIEVASA